MPADSRLRRLVLVGSGRAHLRVLRILSKSLVRGLEIVLVTDEAESHNPAMSSGLLRGAYSLEEARIDLAALAGRAGARLLISPLRSIEVEQGVVVTEAERVPFDHCSLDVVGRPEGMELPGVSEHAGMLRPPSLMPGVRSAVESFVAAAGQRLDCVIVGAGTTGVETAFTMQRWLRDSAHGGVVTLVDGAPTILSDSAACRDLASRALERAGVCFALGARAVEVAADRVVLASGGTLRADLVMWATAGAPPRAIAASGLPHDASGRLLVDAALRARNGAPIWAAGTCASREGSPVGRGVDEGALLAAALRAAPDAPDAPDRHPVAHVRSEPCLLDTGDGRALGTWGRVHTWSRWGWWLKRRRDRRFVAEFAQA